jgi:plastocyanin domain-containing protein
MSLRGKVAVAVVVLLAASGASYSQSSTQDARKVQNVKLTFDAKGYVLTPSTLTKGVPVKMEVDLDSVKGCMRTVVIDAFGVKKTVKTGDTAIEFTPTKAGNIEIVCGMNMGRGSFKVVEAADSK